MFVFVLRRLFWLIFLLLMLSYLCFVMIYLSKGSVAYANSPQALSYELRSRIETNLNLNKPLNEQYLAWLNNFLRGDLSHSLITGESVNELMTKALPNTLILGFFALFVLFITSLFLALLSVFYKDTFIDKSLNFISMSFLATPSFAISLGLILVFAVYLRILPSSQISDLGLEDDLFNRLKHLILPTLALVLAHLGAYLRIFRTILLEALNQGFVEASLARGLSKKRLYFKLILKYSLPPILVYFAANSIAFLVNTYVVEAVFSYAGIGKLVIESIIFKDYPVSLAIIIFSLVGVVVLNFCTELLANLLDLRKSYA